MQHTMKRRKPDMASVFINGLHICKFYYLEKV
ncbi:hypothetical protein HBHAL_1673 [Halobacillus halophilus DSM 2266]|uniref:Uncharacterized protein n=1 Tax=Halobacillus halophilus (strain ATCC 35676 / DSM 2266 / JCM 20832 / KCTC 3685 / LMG 17431 / NBRC 102448 / NCIMB 2269) TaxID=866895 RepID=I0JIS2_HALH3|nr:hypothetical protein HBHAL_1673 [Halobacillus halophilus DSM 2266]